MSAIYDWASYLWKQMKEDYDRDWSAAYKRAETDTNGVMVSKAGKLRGIHGIDLFTGPADRAYKFASEELLAHWQEHKRPNLNDYERQWMEARHSYG